jgi:hypothetical protein
MTLIDLEKASEEFRVKRLIQTVSGVIVMASLDPKVEHRAILIPNPPDGADYKRERRKIEKDYKKNIKPEGYSRLRAISQMFNEVWDARVTDAEGNSSIETYNDMLIWGNCLLDEIPCRHVVLIKIPNGLYVHDPQIESRTEFWKWQNEKFPAMLDAMRAGAAQW